MQIPESNMTNPSRVVVFQARTSADKGRRIFFLLSARQVVEVSENLPVQPIPLAPLHAEGIVYWQQHVLPVMSLEKCLGLADQPAASTAKMLVVRARNKQKMDAGQLNGIFRIGPNIRHIFLPAECLPVNAAEWAPEFSRLRGAYQWRNDILLVPDIEKILNGEINMDSAADNCLAA